MLAEFVYLASASPRRSELLRQIGVPFRVLAAAVDECVRPGEPADDYVMRLAAAKAQRGWDLALAAAGEAAGSGPGEAETPERALAPTPGAAPVLAADTTVVLDDRIFGKPADRAEGLGMLEALSGRTHEVLTAVSLCTAAGCVSRLCRSEVTFRPIALLERVAYWDTGEPRGKAGGYAIQGLAAVFVAALSGSHSGVMGLPLFETAALLDGAGVPRWRDA
jgi:septum formation protein